MKLQAYLDLKQMSDVQFGELVGASEYGVRKWARRERIPRPDAMRKIVEVTEGAVGPSDFFERDAPTVTDLSGVTA